jgi:hypothetical protein
MSLDVAVVLLVIIIGLGFVAITIGDVLLDCLWNRLWRRAKPTKPRDPWTDRTGI